MNPSTPLRVLLVGTIPGARPATCDPALDLVITSDGASVAAAQEVIVPTDAGAEANVPRLPRLGAERRT